MASIKDTISGVSQPAGTELGIFNSGGRHPAAMTGDANAGVGSGVSHSAVPALDSEILSAVRACNGYPKRCEDKTPNLLASRIAKRWQDLLPTIREKSETHIISFVDDVAYIRTGSEGASSSGSTHVQTDQKRPQSTCKQCSRGGTYECSKVCTVCKDNYCEGCYHEHKKVHEEDENMQMEAMIVQINAPEEHSWAKQQWTRIVRSMTDDCKPTRRGRMAARKSGTERISFVDEVAYVREKEERNEKKDQRQTTKYVPKFQPTYNREENKATPTDMPRYVTGYGEASKPLNNEEWSCFSKKEDGVQTQRANTKKKIVNIRLPGDQQSISIRLPEEEKEF